MRPIDHPARAFNVDRVSEVLPRSDPDHDRRPTRSVLRVEFYIDLRDVNDLIRPGRERLLGFYFHSQAGADANPPSDAGSLLIQG